jgi:hypothetical protein
VEVLHKHERCRLLLLDMTNQPVLFHSRFDLQSVALVRTLVERGRSHAVRLICVDGVHMPRWVTSVPALWVPPRLLLTGGDTIAEHLGVDELRGPSTPPASPQGKPKKD